MRVSKNVVYITGADTNEELTIAYRENGNFLIQVQTDEGEARMEIETSAYDLINLFSAVDNMGSFKP